MSQNPKTDERRDNDGLHKRRGIWYYCLNVNGERRFFSTKTHNYQEARRARAEAVKAQLENRLPTDAAKQRFETLLAQVLEDRKPHLAENTIRLERERSGPLLKHFAGRRVSEIDAAAIRGFQTARVKQVSTRTVNLECKILRQVLKAAKIWGPIADDFKPLKEDRRGPGRALDDSQERLLFDTARSKPEWDAAFYAAMVAANTTMRGCEIKGLRLQNVNLMEREVSIQRTKGNTAGVRRIPLNDGALWGFARLLERAAALGSVAPEHFLIPSLQCIGSEATRPRPRHGLRSDAPAKDVAHRMARPGEGNRPAGWKGSGARRPGRRPRVACRYRRMETGRGARPRAEVSRSAPPGNHEAGGKRSLRPNHHGIAGPHGPRHA